MATDADLIAKYRQYNPNLDRYTDEEITQIGLPGFEQPMGINTIPNQFTYRNQFMNDMRNLPSDIRTSLGQTKDALVEDFSGLQNIIGSGVDKMQQGLGFVKDKTDQGFDFAKQIPNMLLSAATGIPFAGQIAQGIGGLLGSVFQESPEQKNFRENIATDPEYQNLVNSIPGMSNYNQIFGMGSGRGLMGAIDKRLATLARTEKRQGVNFSDTLKERRKKLEALREIERQKESAFLESQRRGRAPTAPSGGGSQDTGAAGGFSPGQAGAGTGGYSYDSGGRQGFGYGLKDGGLASMFTRRG